MVETRIRSAWVLLALLTLSSFAPTVAADPGNPEVVNTTCSTWNSTSGICDDYNFEDDATAAMEWVEGRYHIQMANATMMAVTMEWAIYEVSRDIVLLEDLPLGNGSDPEVDGIPADYLRNYLGLVSWNGATVKENLRASVTATVTSMINNGLGTTQGAQTFYVDQITLEGQDVQCTDDPDIDSADEVAGLRNDAYDPPLCLQTTLSIMVDPAALGMTEVGFEIERAYQGLLTMGGEIRTQMNLTSLPGHLSSYEFVPPAYGELVDISSGGVSIPASSGGFDYAYARWQVDHRDAVDNIQWLNLSTSITMARREDTTRPVWIDQENERGIEVEILIDATDERVTTVEVSLAIHYIGAETLEGWDWQLADDRVSMPWVTSDGLRLAHHSGLANLSEFAAKVPFDDLDDSISQYSPTEVSFTEFVFTPPDGDGGLDFSHRPGQTCAENSPSPWCIEGPTAMNGTYPIYLTSRSNTFELNIGELANSLSDDFGLDSNGYDFTIPTREDQAAILNGVRVMGSVQTDLLAGWMPSDLPPTDVTLTVMLPSHMRSTTGDSRTLTLRHLVGENSSEDISLTGAEPYDWHHPICQSPGPCQPTDLDLVCDAQRRTCIAVNIEIDLEDLDVHEWSQSLEMVAKTQIELLIYRIGVPQSSLENQSSVEIEVMPADLIRRAAVIGDRMDGGLHAPIDADLTVPIDGEDVPLVLTTAGLHQFASDVGRVMEDRVNLEVTKMVDDQNPDDEVMFDIPHVGVSASIDGLEPSPGSALDDRRPIRILLEVDSTTIAVEYLGNDISMTGAIGGWTTAMLSVGSLRPQAAQGDITGIELPRDEDIVVEMGAPSFESDGELIAPAVTLKVTFPRGLGFAFFDSEMGRETLSESGGSQVLVYHLPICTANTVEECDQQTDTVTFRMVVGIEFILAELAIYIGTLVGLVLLLIFLRMRRKRRRKEALLDEEGERLATLSPEEADLIGEDGLPEMAKLPGLDGTGNIPSEGWDEGYEDLLDFDDP